MRWRPRAILAVLALACAAGIACGGGGHDTTTVIPSNWFPQGFLPVLAGSGRGDVALRVEGDLYFVDAETANVTAVSHSSGDSSSFASGVGGAGNELFSISVGAGDDGRLFVGDVDGRIWEISTLGIATLFFETDTGDPITGLAFAPSGFGDFGGSLLAARGAARISVISVISDTEQHEVATLGRPGESYVDLAFSGTTLLAINATRRQIETVSPSNEVALLPSTPVFTAPVGIAVDSTASEIYVADGGDDLLYTVPVAGGARTARAAYRFASTAPSGIAYDGIGAIAFVTSEPAIRGANLPRVVTNANFGRIFLGPTIGYGDLEFDRSGGFVLVANNTTTNFVFSALRDLISVSALQSGIGETGEQLLSLAIDPKTQTIYLGTDLGNLFGRTSDGIVTQLIDAPVGAPAMLGLELAPQAFCPDPNPCLVATTENGTVIQIDLNAPDLDDVIRSEPGARFSDLVFASDGTLYVVDSDDADPPIGSRILEFGPAGNFVDDLTVDGRLDGIEIDEGGDRLLVVAEQTAGPDQVLEITLPLSPSSDVTALADIDDVDDGYFPTGIIYDRLGNVAVRQGNNFTALQAKSVGP